ncbi:MAG: HpaII family restriction endonuclease [bacterium]|nr:HpaII family restriction endonuclease [bacterium]
MGKNRGEWSEMYVVLSLLENPNLNIVDSKLEEICNDLFIVEKLSIKEKQKLIDFILTSKKEVEIYFQNELKNMISIEEIENSIEMVKNSIKNVSSGKGAFEIKELNPILKKMTDQDFLKSDSQTKSDLIATVLDTKISDRVVLKYSIKSSLGSPATLLNASHVTDFLYEIEGLKREHIALINQITTSKSKTKLRDGLKKIYEFGGKIKFVDVPNESFKYNLEMVDSNMPLYLGKALLNFYNDVSGNLKELFLSTNEFKDEEFAIKKLSDFFKGISFGFFPNKKWDKRS